MSSTFQLSKYVLHAGMRKQTANKGKRKNETASKSCARLKEIILHVDHWFGSMQASESGFIWLEILGNLQRRTFENLCRQAIKAKHNYETRSFVERQSGEQLQRELHAYFPFLANERRVGELAESGVQHYLIFSPNRRNESPGVKITQYSKCRSASGEIKI